MGYAGSNPAPVTMSYIYNKPDMATALEQALHDGKDMDLDLGLEYDIWY